MMSRSTAAQVERLLTVAQAVELLLKVRTVDLYRACELLPVRGPNRPTVPRRGSRQ